MARAGLQIALKGLGFLLIRERDVGDQPPWRVFGRVRGFLSVVLREPLSQVRGDTDIALAAYASLCSR